MLYIYIWSEVKWKSLSCVYLFATPWTVHGDSPGQNTRMGSHFLLQVIFPTQGSNPVLPHRRWILYMLNHKGSPYVCVCVCVCVCMYNLIICISYSYSLWQYNFTFSHEIFWLMLFDHYKPNSKELQLL